jgi:hypothetical protein
LGSPSPWRGGESFATSGCCARLGHRGMDHKDLVSNSAHAKRSAEAGLTGAVLVRRLRRADRLAKTLKRHTIRFHKGDYRNSRLSHRYHRHKRAVLNMLPGAGTGDDQGEDAGRAGVHARAARKHSRRGRRTSHTVLFRQNGAGGPSAPAPESSVRLPPGRCDAVLGSLRATGLSGPRSLRKRPIWSAWGWA